MEANRDQEKETPPVSSRFSRTIVEISRSRDFAKSTGRSGWGLPVPVGAGVRDRPNPENPDAANPGRGEPRESLGRSSNPLGVSCLPELRTLWPRGAGGSVFRRAPEETSRPLRYRLGSPPSGRQQPRPVRLPRSSRSAIQFSRTSPGFREYRKPHPCHSHVLYLPHGKAPPTDRPAGRHLHR